MFYLNQSYNRRCNRPIAAPIHIKHVQYSFSYQWATYQKYDWCGCESPSGYGALEWVLELADSSLESADKESLQGFPWSSGDKHYTYEK